LFQLVVSPFNWIDEAMDYPGEKVGQVLNTEASHGRIVEDQADLIKEEITIDRLTKKYLWWTPKSPIDGTTNRGIREQECLPALSYDARDYINRGVCQTKNSSDVPMSSLLA
jgi:hypothetical protein